MTKLTIDQLPDGGALADTDWLLVRRGTTTYKVAGSTISGGSGGDASTLDGLDSTAFARAAHTHAIGDVTGLQSALDGKQATIAAGTTAQYWRGDKSWQDLGGGVRAVALTGLSTVTNATITATDTVLTAPGKLQAQITGHVGSGGAAHAAATTAAAGFMSSADKTKLDGIAAGAQVNSVTSVAGKTGAVTLAKADVGLGSVDNTSDADKPVSTAQQMALNAKLDATANAVSASKLAAPVTINGVSFDGSASITVADSAKEPAFAAGTTAQYRRGDKTWQDLATAVRAAVMTGLSTATAAAVAATDTLLSAIGKLQAQVNGLASGKLDATANAVSASKLATARTLSTTGDATGSALFDGSADTAIALTLANSGVTTGTYPKVTVDAKGRVTTGAALAATDIPSLDASKITSGTLADARLPARLGAVAATITDWNAATSNGWYMASNGANAPVASTWFIGTVENHGAVGWCTQTVHAFSTDSEGDTKTYRREQNNGVWGTWQRVRVTEAEQSAIYLNASNINAGTLPLSRGGTGGADATTARTNLDVYSKAEVDVIVQTPSPESLALIQATALCF